MRAVCDEARKENAGIKQQVRDIGNKFLNNVEISAQEAVYIVLKLPMRKLSVQVVFVNTLPPEDSVRLLKCLSDIKKWKIIVRNYMPVDYWIDIPYVLPN